MDLHTATLSTPVGPFTLLVDGDGVCAAGFTGHAETLRRRLDPAPPGRPRPLERRSRRRGGRDARLLRR